MCSAPNRVAVGTIFNNFSILWPGFKPDTSSKLWRAYLDIKNIWQKPISINVVWLWHNTYSHTHTQNTYRHKHTHITTITLMITYKEGNSLNRLLMFVWISILKINIFWIIYDVYNMVVAKYYFLGPLMVLTLIIGKSDTTSPWGGGVIQPPPLLSQLLNVLETQTKRQKVAKQNLRGGNPCWFYRFFAVIYS